MGKKPKRGRGEGAIFQRKEDGLWVTSLDLGRDPKTGKRRRYTLYGKTRAEVVNKLKKAWKDLDSGISIDATKTTLAQYLTRWLADSVKPSVRDSTYQGYECICRVHIIPAIGGVTLAKLTPPDLQHLYNEKLASGLSARTVRYIHATLHRSLVLAVKWGLLARNVADAVDLPQANRHKVNPLNAEQIGQLLEAAREDRLEALYILAVTTGMRQGELLGLRWQDVDFDRATVQVRQALTTTHAGRTLGEPKTDSARRLITLAPIAVEALRGHRVKQLEQRLLAGEQWQDFDLVFASTSGTPMHPSNLVNHSFLPLLKRANLHRIRFHDLRHTAATLLLSEGVHPKIVQERLGHSQISLTLDTYSHILPSMQAEAASKIDKLFPVRKEIS